MAIIKRTAVSSTGRAHMSRPVTRQPANTGQRVALLGGIVSLLVGWQVLSGHMHQAIVASPLDTARALQALWISGEIGHAIQITLGRLLTALIMGSGLGIGLGLLAGFSALLRAFLEPLRWVLMSLPAVFVAILGMLWFEIDDQQVVFLVAVVITPVIYVNTLAGMDHLDRQLIEMGRVFRFSWRQMIMKIYLPGISLHVLAGLRLAVGIGVRAVVMAELLGAFDGVGRSFSQAWTFLKTPEMFAWMIVSLFMMAVLEFGILLPFSRGLARWRQP